ncbi:hypothetical protein [Stutzerimonas frequens]|nr:hypothetical protein [Stutzerimonas frequens]
MKTPKRRTIIKKAKKNAMPADKDQSEIILISDKPIPMTLWSFPTPK